MKRKKRPLRVSRLENVIAYDWRGKPKDVNGPGWYIEAYQNGKYYALVALRFLRELDADIALSTLRANGIDNLSQMRRAGGERVKQLAGMNLQW